MPQQTGIRKFQVGDEVIVRNGVVRYSITTPGSIGIVRNILDEGRVGVDFSVCTDIGRVGYYDVEEQHLDYLHPIGDWDG
jgi:hypothetical protein